MLFCHMLHNPETYVVKLAWRKDTESLQLLVTLKIPTWPTCHGSTCFAALAQKQLQQLLDRPIFDLRKVENYSIKKS